MVNNSKEYWNQVYEKEINSHWSRGDIPRWQLILSQVGETDKVLEFGCGTGEFIYWLCKQRPFCYYIGIDISSVGIEKAKQMMPNFRWYEGNGLDCINYKELGCDIIISQHTYEHLTPEGRIQFMKDAHTILPQNGKLVLVFPIHDKEWQEHDQIWEIEDVAKLVREWKKEWNITVIWRPQTVYKRADGHNDNDYEEALIFMRKR